MKDFNGRKSIDVEDNNLSALPGGAKNVGQYVAPECVSTPSASEVASSAFAHLVEMLKAKQFAETQFLYTSDAAIAPETSDWWVTPGAMPARFASIPPEVLVQFTAPGSFKVVVAKYDGADHRAVDSVIDWAGGVAVLYIRYVRARCADADSRRCPWKMAAVIDRGHDPMAACNATIATAGATTALGIVTAQWKEYTALLAAKDYEGTLALYTPDNTVAPIYADDSTAIRQHDPKALAGLSASFSEVSSVRVLSAKFDSPQNQRTINALVNWGGRVLYMNYQYVQTQPRVKLTMHRQNQDGAWLIKEVVIKGICPAGANPEGDSDSDSDPGAVMKMLKQIAAAQAAQGKQLHSLSGRVAALELEESS